jgi:hypothetical protein
MVGKRRVLPSCPYTALCDQGKYENSSSAKSLSSRIAQTRLSLDSPWRIYKIGFIALLRILRVQWQATHEEESNHGMPIPGHPRMLENTSEQVCEMVEQ